MTRTAILQSKSKLPGSEDGFRTLPRAMGHQVCSPHRSSCPKAHLWKSLEISRDFEKWKHLLNSSHFVKRLLQLILVQICAFYWVCTLNSGLMSNKQVTSWFVIKEHSLYVFLCMFILLIISYRLANWKANRREDIWSLSSTRLPCRDPIVQWLAVILHLGHTNKLHPSYGSVGHEIDEIDETFPTL